MDFTPEAAKFIVIGSTGNHYVVALTDTTHKCATSHLHLVGYDRLA